MQLINKNKMVSEANNKDVEKTPINTNAEQEFHFSGDLVYLPLVVKAKDLEEATEKWKTLRVPINQTPQAQIINQEQEKG